MKHLGLVGAAASLAGIAVALVAIGRAHAAPDGGARVFPDPSQVTPSGLTAQTQEPATGFTGACLVDYRAYQPTLPLICYSPSTGQYGSGQTQVTFPAQAVFRSYDSLPPQYDSYQTLLTCYPHNPGTCPNQSFAVSNSCCDYGMNLTSLDGKTASGFVNF